MKKYVAGTNITADSIHDYGITTQAKAIFELGRLHIKKALKTELINSGRYSPVPTYYADTEDGEPGVLRKFNASASFEKSLRGCKLVFASSEKFIRGTDYKPFILVFAFFDPTTTKRINNWDGFFTQQGISLLPTIILYCSYDPPQRTSLGFIQAKDVAQQLVSALNIRTQDLKTVFVHEFGHNYNFLQWMDKNKGNVPKVKYNSPPLNHSTPQELKQYEAYVNDPQEVNARYLEWIHAIQTSFNRLLRIKDADYDIRKAFPTFHDFWDFYWTTPGFVPEALAVWASIKTKQRLAKRMAGFYNFLVNNPASNPVEVEDFIKKQMEVDYNAPSY